jgi:transposase
MAKPYKPYEPEQSLLFPPNIKDWLPESHLAYFVSDVVEQLDLSRIEAYYEKDFRGQPPYNPRMMTKILLYGYCIGVFSSRRIQKALIEEVPFRVLAAGNQPDFRTISDFRKIHRAALQGLFEQVLEMALTVGAMKLGRVALDGSKIKANASKHKAMSYNRMKEKETQPRQEVRDLLRQADEADAREDAQYGRDRRGDELPEELSRRETRLAKIREAKRALEEKARAEAKESGKDPGKAQPKDTDQRNFTDPESRIMKGPDGFVQGYNAQVAVEDTLQLIVGQSVRRKRTTSGRSCRWLRPSRRSRVRSRRNCWPTVAIALKRTWSSWKQEALMRTLRRKGRCTASGRTFPPVDGYRRRQPVSIACAGNSGPGTGLPFTRRGRRSWNRSSVRSSKAGDSGSSCCEESKRSGWSGRWCARRTTS